MGLPKGLHPFRLILSKVGKRLKVRVGRSPRSKFEEVKESSKKEEEENVIPSSVVDVSCFCSFFYFNLDYDLENKVERFCDACDICSML